MNTASNRLIAAGMMLAACALIISAAGCNENNGQFTWPGTTNNKDKTEPVPPKEANVVGVSVMSSGESWLKFGSEGDRRPDGIKLTVLLQAGNKPKGVFGDGIIKISMYRVEPPKLRREVTSLLKEWTFDPDKALDYMVRKQTGYGWLYSFRLPWGDADINGHEAKFVVRFTRKDNNVITSLPHYIKVPNQAGEGSVR